jgi:transglutaminase-like putative cysteine protease
VKPGPWRDSRAPWLDHLPPWLAWGAIASTGYYAPWELGLMLWPLLAALLVQRLAEPLDRWQRALELLALAALAAHLALRAGLLPTVTDMLFLLCGVRLCLRREPAQRRQLLLMGFLLFLTTAVTTADPDFLLWSVLWLGGSATVLLRLNWEPAARLRPGTSQAPPYLRLAGWCGAALALGAGFFVSLPRLGLGLRYLPAGIQGMNGLQAGLSDLLDLTGRGPIRSSREVALRIQPSRPLTADQRRAFAGAMGLLRGLVLEALDGQRWELSPLTPQRPHLYWNGSEPRSALAADFHLGPALMGIIPLPYGRAELAPGDDTQRPGGDALRPGAGASLRWQIPVRRIASLHLVLDPGQPEREPPPRGERLALLTAAGTESQAALDWSRRVVPGDLPAGELARRLTAALRTGFRYTLDNPSGGAANPLQDFLERSRAGHCEYFASALALMLRHRGIPARVANGYRLGPWIEEGGYFLVTQDEAHSWVEYYDAASGSWRVADPTPPAPASALDSGGILTALARWSDSLRFRWDRNVVRFSDQDQVTGLGWIQDRAAALARWRPGRAARVLAASALVALLGWAGRGWAGQRWPGASRRAAGPGRVPALRPLLRRAGRALPPLPGETARAWLERLARANPSRALQLASLARAVDAATYGAGPATPLKPMAQEEARHW